MVVCHIEIGTNGSISLSSKINFAFNGGLPKYWTHRTTAILGIPSAAFTINFRDVIGDDEDILRLKRSHGQMFINTRYNTATLAYDDRDNGNIQTMAIEPNDEPSQTDVEPNLTSVQTESNPVDLGGPSTTPVEIEGDEAASVYGDAEEGKVVMTLTCHSTPEPEELMIKFIAI